MSGTIDLELSINHPEQKLETFYAYAGSVESPKIDNAPKDVGNWHLTALYISEKFPDGTLVKTQCHGYNAGKWIATLPKCDTPGTVELGFCVVADGVDHEGHDFENMVLGCGDLTILPNGGHISPDELTPTE